MAKKKNTQREDGRIAVQVYIGTVDGKRKYKTVYGKTQKEAENKASQIKLSLNKGLDISMQRDTFKTWADRWIALKKADVSHSQYCSYKSYLKHYGSIQNIPLSKIKTADIQIIITTLATGRENQKPLAKKTLREIKSTANQIFKMAIQNRVLDYNPVDAVSVPNKAHQGVRRALTEEEQSWIIDTPHRAQLPCMIMMFAGLRRGELIPLTWSDINLKNATIDINKSVELINGRPIVKNTAKTKSSIRTVAIPDILVDYLKEKKKETTSSILVCPSASGQLMSDSSWRRMWNSYLKDLNIKYGDFSNYLKRPKSKFCHDVEMVIPRFTAHWLRHTFATMLYFAGVDVLTAKEQLGHSDIQTTLNIYTHLDDKYKRKSMNKLNDYIKCRSDASQMQVNAR